MPLVHNKYKIMALIPVFPGAEIAGSHSGNAGSHSIIVSVKKMVDIMVFLQDIGMPKALKNQHFMAIL